VRVRIVWIFNTFGPCVRLRDGRAVPAFMTQALRGEDITVFGEGEQTRSFCYISALVDGVLRLMESDLTEPVNIGNPHEIFVETMARTIVRLAGSESRIVHEALPVDDLRQRRPDSPAPGRHSDGNPRSAWMTDSAARSTTSDLNLPCSAEGLTQAYHVPSHERVESATSCGSLTRRRILAI
jgi:nucleoside-diphosphate-sugar epimerase